MSTPLLFSILESPLHRDHSAVYQQLGYQQFCFPSMRKAISGLRKQVPEVVVTDFIYGYGSNYAGINISNVDVFLLSLQKYKADARIILMVEKHERQFVDKLNELYPIHDILTYPVSDADIRASIEN